MYFVYQTRYEPHGNGKAPDWPMIDFIHKGLIYIHHERNWIWGKDIYQEIKANPEKFLIVEAKDYEHLMMTKEYKQKWEEYVMTAIKPDSNLGWIAPSGQFIGCDYYDHSFVAEEYLHSSEERLENEGWCKIYALGKPEAEKNLINFYTKNNRLTAAQEQTIKEICEKFDVPGAIRRYLKEEGII